MLTDGKIVQAVSVKAKKKKLMLKGKKKAKKISMSITYQTAETRVVDVMQKNCVITH